MVKTNNLARDWVRRINDAIDRLELDERAESFEKVMGIIQGTWGLNPKTYVDINDGLPRIEQMIHSALPALPTPNVSMDTPDIGPCDLCGGLGETGGRPCPECAGTGIEELHTDRKSEAYLGAVSKSGAGNVLAAVHQALWHDAGWGVGFLKTVWRQQRKKVSRGGAEPLEPQTYPAVDQARPDIGEAGDVVSFPAVEAVLAERVVYDPFATQWSDVGWYAELSTEFLEDLKQLKGSRTKHLRPQESMDDEEEPTANLPESDYRVDVWKIHDYRNGKYIILPAQAASGKRRVSRYGEQVEPILVRDNPNPCRIFVPLTLRHPAWDKLHGQAALALIEKPLRELARINRAIRLHVKKHSAYKRVFPAGALGSKGQQELRDPDKSDIEMPERAMAVMGNNEVKPPPIPQSLLDHRQTLLESIGLLLGAENMSTAEPYPHQISATEADVRAGFQSERASVRQQKIGNSLTQVYQNFLALFARFGDPGGFPVAVEGLAGREPDVFKPDDVPDSPVISVNLEEVTPEGQVRQITARQQYYNVLMQTGVGDPRKVMEAWGRDIGLSQAEQLFMDEQDFMQSPEGGLTANEKTNEKPNVPNRMPSDGNDSGRSAGNV